jgi:hypothetical protein
VLAFRELINVLNNEKINTFLLLQKYFQNFLLIKNKFSAITLKQNFCMMRNNSSKCWLNFEIPLMPHRCVESSVAKGPTNFGSKTQKGPKKNLVEPENLWSNLESGLSKKVSKRPDHFEVLLLQKTIKFLATGFLLDFYIKFCVEKSMCLFNQTLCGAELFPPAAELFG